MTISEKSITLEMDSKDKDKEGRLITFDPSTYQGLRHGYAGTVYKAQGATIHQTYVLHAPHADVKSNYVALTRQSESMRIFIDQSQTKNEDALAHQLSRVDPWKTIPSYLVPVDGNAKDTAPETLFTAIKQTILETITPKIQSLKDYFHTNPEFYAFKDNPQEVHKVIKVESVNEVKKTPEQNSAGALKTTTNPDTINLPSLKESNHAQASEKIKNPEDYYEQTKLKTPAPQPGAIQSDTWQKKEAVYLELHQSHLYGEFEKTHGVIPGPEEIKKLDFLAQRITNYRMVGESSGILNEPWSETKTLSLKERFTHELFVLKEQTNLLIKQDHVEVNTLLLRHDHARRMATVAGRQFASLNNPILSNLDTALRNENHFKKLTPSLEAITQEITYHNQNWLSETHQYAILHNLNENEKHLLNELLICVKERFGQLNVNVIEKAAEVIIHQKERIEEFVKNNTADNPYVKMNHERQLTWENEAIFNSYFKSNDLRASVENITTNVKEEILDLKERFLNYQENKSVQDRKNNREMDY